MKVLKNTQEMRKILYEKNLKKGKSNFNEFRKLKREKSENLDKYSLIS